MSGAAGTGLGGCWGQGLVLKELQDGVEGPLVFALRSPRAVPAWPLGEALWFSLQLAWIPPKSMGVWVSPPLAQLCVLARTPAALPRLFLGRWLAGLPAGFSLCLLTLWGYGWAGNYQILILR